MKWLPHFGRNTARDVLEFECGYLLAHQIGQKLGARIWLEAGFLAMTPAKKACEAAEQAKQQLAALQPLRSKWSDAFDAKATRALPRDRGRRGGARGPEKAADCASIGSGRPRVKSQAVLVQRISRFVIRRVQN
jgi:hypothetical protein